MPEVLDSLRPSEQNNSSTLKEMEKTDSAPLPKKEPCPITSHTPMRNDWQNRVLKMDVTHPEIQAASDAVQEWAFGFYRNAPKERHIVLSGSAGTGKTTMAEKIHRWARMVAIPAWSVGKWSHPPRIEWTEWGQIAFLPFDEFKRWLDGMCDIDVLFLEDVGAEVDKFKAGETTERLRQLLNEFKAKRMFVTTNIMPENWENRWDDRVFDRLLRDSVLVQLRNVPRFTSI